MYRVDAVYDELGLLYESWWFKTPYSSTAVPSGPLPRYVVLDRGIPKAFGLI